MRYSLRNQDKIINAYDKKTLDRIVLSLDIAFKNNTFEKHDIENEPYPIIDINDETHSCGIILFYLISVKYDVYNLAFKEIVN